MESMAKMPTKCGLCGGAPSAAAHELSSGAINFCAATSHTFDVFRYCTVFQNPYIPLHINTIHYYSQKLHQLHKTIHHLCHLIPVELWCNTYNAKCTIELCQLNCQQVQVYNTDKTPQVKNDLRLLA